MRALILAVLLFPLAAQAQQAPTPQQFTVPTGVLNHVVAFLSNGGTHLEGQALAEQLIQMAQQQMAAQKAPEAAGK